jgi:hypothetical protein
LKKVYAFLIFFPFSLGLSPLYAFLSRPAVYHVIGTAEAQTPPTAPILPATSTIQAYMTSVAIVKGANPILEDWVGAREGRNFDPTAVGDKDFICPVPTSPLYGQISPSYGLAQINRCYHPDISIASSEDPVFAANWIANEIIAGRAREDWTTVLNCRKWFPHTCPL